jgi:hypothetical protein
MYMSPVGAYFQLKLVVTALPGFEGEQVGRKLNFMVEKSPWVPSL